VEDELRRRIPQLGRGREAHCGTIFSWAKKKAGSLTFAPNSYFTSFEIRSLTLVRSLCGAYRDSSCQMAASFVPFPFPLAGPRQAGGLRPRPRRPTATSCTSTTLARRLASPALASFSHCARVLSTP